MQKPSLARMVIVKVDPAMNNGSPEAPAVITRVWSDTMINVRVFVDNAGAEIVQTSVTLHESKPEDVDAKPSNAAWWPPRV